jgi:hypothetical protein
MKRRYIFLLNLLFLLLLGSCRKKVIEEITFPVFAGVYNDEMLFREFEPPLQIQLQTDTLQNIQYGIDSIDIDLDGSFDILVLQRIYLDWSDNFNRNELKKDNFPFIGLNLKNGFNIAFKRMSFPTGQGSYNSVAMVDTILHNTRLDKITDWENSNSGFVNYMGYFNNAIWMWGAPPTTYWLLGNYGPWYSLINREIYIGIRKGNGNDSKLGWIKIKIYSRDKFEIMSYAIEK